MILKLDILGWCGTGGEQVMSMASLAYKDVGTIMSCSTLSWRI